MADRTIAFACGIVSAVVFIVSGILLSQNKADGIHISQFLSGIAFGSLALAVAFGFRGRE